MNPYEIHRVSHRDVWQVLAEDIVAVTLSREKVNLSVQLPFYCHTDGYRPILHRNNFDPERVRYINGRYNQAVETALHLFPKARHVFIIDSYYLSFKRSIERLVDDYQKLERALIGGTILCWDRSRVRHGIVYYDTLSVPELKGKRWPRTSELPTGIVEASGIGASWIMPREVWDRTGGFRIETPLANTRCLDIDGYKVLLDWNAQFWRTHETNPEILDEDYPLKSRLYRSIAMTARVRSRLGLKRKPDN